MMMKTNKCFMRLGYRRMININHITNIAWEFNDSNSNAKITIYFDNRDAINEHLNVDEFKRFINDIKELEI